MNTTENTIREPEIRKLPPAHEARTDNSTLKKGQRVKVLLDPKKPDSQVVGFGVLTKCNDTKVYLDAHGFENWNVRLDFEEQSSPRIVHARNVIAE